MTDQDDRNSANTTAKQYKEKEAKRLALEKAKRIQGQNDTKDTEAKRHMIEKAKRIQGQNDTKDTEAKRHMIEKAKIEALSGNIDHIHRKHLTR